MTEQTKAPPPAAKAEKEYFPYSQQETLYTQVSPTLGQACQNCRWFRGYTCAIVTDMAPKDIVPMGWCNKWETEPAEITAIVQPVLIVDESAVSGIITTMPTGMGERSTPEGGEYIRTPPMNIVVKGKTQPATPRQQLLRDKSGRRYMFIVTSNGYKDREEEWIPADELKSYVDSCWIDEKTFHSDNPLLFWHDPALNAGDIIWADMDGPFLIELAREGDSPIAKALWDYREANPRDELWGASHGFRYQRRSNDGVYAGIRKKETSFLPLWAAANSLTASEVLTVMKSRDEYINGLFKQFNVENAADLLRTGTQKLTDALAAAGVNSKAAEGAAPQPTFSPQAAALIVEMIDMQKSMLDRLDALETKAKDAPTVLSVPPELSSQIAALASGVQEVRALLELPASQASKDGATVVPPTSPAATEAKEALHQKEAGGTYDPFFGDMKVPLPGAQS